MRITLSLTAGLFAGILALPAQAAPRESEFVTIGQCENFLDRWRDSLERPHSAPMAYLRPYYAAAYCVQSSNGRYNVVWPY